MCLARLVYNGPKMKLGSCCRERKMQLSGPTLRSLANFYTEVEQFCCLLSAAKACIWNIRHDNKLHVVGKFLFPHQKYCGPQNFSRLENSMCLIFVAWLAYLFMSVLSYRARNRGGRSKKCFLVKPQFEQQIGASEYFPGRFMNCQNFWAIELFRSL